MESNFLYVVLVVSNEIDGAKHIRLKINIYRKGYTGYVRDRCSWKCLVIVMG